MKRTTLITIHTLIILSVYTIAHALSASEAISGVKKRMASIKQMSGIISFGDKTGLAYVGSFKYMSPGLFYIKFNSPHNKVLVCNTKKLWIYDPGNNICAIQDVSTGYSGGIVSMISSYNGIVTSQGSAGYTLKLKNSDRTYSEIILKVDSSFLIKKATMIRSNGDGIIFSLSNINTKANLLRKQFDFSVPANTQVIKNPLNIK